MVRKTGGGVGVEFGARDADEKELTRVVGMHTCAEESKKNLRLSKGNSPPRPLKRGFSLVNPRSAVVKLPFAALRYLLHG